MIYRGSCKAEVEFEFTTWVPPKATANFHSWDGWHSFICFVYLCKWVVGKKATAGMVISGSGHCRLPFQCHHRSPSQQWKNTIYPFTHRLKSKPCYVAYFYRKEQDQFQFCLEQDFSDEFSNAEFFTVIQSWHLCQYWHQRIYNSKESYP